MTSVRTGASKREVDNRSRQAVTERKDIRNPGPQGANSCRKRAIQTRIRAVSIVIRQADAKDFSALFKLDQKCFPPGIAYSKTMLKHFLTIDGAECLVALDENQIVAFLLTQENPPLAHITTLDVAESHRRKGIGTMLLEESENNLRFRGVRTMLLETAITNEAGVAFWQRHGYRIEAVVKNYYPGHLDAYEMRKRLSADSKAKPQTTPGSKES